jgi:hypothetical protein
LEHSIIIKSLVVSSMLKQNHGGESGETERSEVRRAQYTGEVPADVLSSLFISGFRSLQFTAGTGENVSWGDHLQD